MKLRRLFCETDKIPTICFIPEKQNRENILYCVWFLGILGGILRKQKKLIKIISTYDFDYIFCDFSCFGNTIKKIKKIKENIKIVSFFHNVESCYEINRMKNENPLFFFLIYLQKNKRNLLFVFRIKPLS